MLVDAAVHTIDGLAQASFDVCICGGGPAGITLALRLAAKGWKVALCEGGGVYPSAESQELYAGETVGQSLGALDTVRLRFLGGSSNHWDGYCRALDTYDFQKHPFHNLSGWPIPKSDLDPYIPAAQKILDIKPIRYNWEYGDRVPADYAETEYWYSPPTRFGEKYLKQLEADPQISLIFNANLVDIRLSDNLAQVSEFRFRALEGEEPFSIRARHYALCLGGIENPRALLNCDSQMKSGIGNGKDLVGRFFSEHPETLCGYAILASRNFTPRFFTPAPDGLDREHCLNHIAILEPLNPDRSWAREAVADSACMSDFTLKIAKAVTGRDPVCLDAEVSLMIEQELNRESRVFLTGKKDSLGLRRTGLDWRLTDLDMHTFRNGALAFGKFLAEMDLGRMRLADWLDPANPISAPPSESIIGSFHHMCTTRMSDTPDTGVVDPDCRVHGVENLYIGGSSVFATAGHANPTFTIIQMSLRLADHLTERMKA